MKIAIRHQESYSRGELLLRSFFGFLYIAIPHGICLMFLGLGAQLCTLLAFFIILFTGSYPKGMFDFVVKVQRWGFRVNARMLNLSDGYPAFGLDAHDNNSVFDVTYNEKSNRLTVLLRFLLAPLLLLPHILCIIFIEIGALICILLAWFIVLFTGKYPVGMHGFVTGFLRWVMRIQAYMLFLTDTYPPFTLEETDKVNWDEKGGIEDHLVG